MPDNRLRTTLTSGAGALGGWCAIPDSFATEIVAAAGFDYVAVDMQHGLATFSDLVPMLQAIAVHGPTPLVRIPVGDLAMAQRALDAGAEGIIVPYVGTSAEARAAVMACRYPPIGNRSFGPVRSRLHLGADTEEANAQVLCVVMIETREGVDNLADILAMTGVDAVYVGPADLALSLGESSQVEDVIAEIVAACRSAGTPVGVHTRSGSDAADALQRGFAFATVSTDAALLTAVYAAELAAAHADRPS